MDLNKRRNLMKTFITSQFSSHFNLNKKINWIHEQALRLVYQNNLNFSEFFRLDNSLRKSKKLIKSWKPEGCLCRLRKTYIAQLGFI